MHSGQGKLLPQTVRSNIQQELGSLIGNCIRMKQKFERTLPWADASRKRPSLIPTPTGLWLSEDCHIGRKRVAFAL